MSDTLPTDSSGYELPPLVAVDLDGTLAEIRENEPYDPTRIGEPIMEMVMTVFNHLHAGNRVCIFTARVDPTRPGWEQAKQAIERWCFKHFNQVFPVTAIKSYEIRLFYDDKCAQIVKNTGKRIDGQDGSTDLELPQL